MIQQHLNTAETMCFGLVSNVQTYREVMGHACFIIASTITKHYYFQDLSSGPYKHNLTEVSHGFREADAMMINILQMWKLLGQRDQVICPKSESEL